MRRTLLVVAVVFLAVSSLPNSAASTAIVAENATSVQTTAGEEFVVGSSHSTENDFSAGSITNLSVAGSGDPASLILPRLSYNVITDSGDGTVDNDVNLAGDLGDNTTEIRGFKVRPSRTINATSLTVDLSSNIDGSDYGFSVDVRAVPENPDTSFGEGELIATWDPDFEEGEQQISLDSRYNFDAGTNYTIEFITKSSDNDGVQDLIRVNRDDSFSSTWSSSSGFTFDIGGDVTLTEKPESGQYISDIHSVNNAQQAFANVSVSNGVIDYRWEYESGGSWVVASSGTWTTTGNHTVSLPDVASGSWRLNATYQNRSGATNLQIHDEGILFTPQAPDIDNTSLEPNSTQSSVGTPLELSADISDFDFTRDDGEELTVEWFVDGQKRGTTTATGNGTVSYTLDSVDAGEHDWQIKVTDQWGWSTTSATAEFVTPSDLRIYNESSPDDLVDNATVTIEYYFRDDGGSSDLIVTRNTSNGVINMTGLPTTQPFVVVAEADGYVSRRIFVSNLSATQQVYLLPDQGQVTQNEFVIQDLTGFYPQEDTVLQIQRSLNSEWRTVHGDYFGASGSFPATLRYNVRHRLIVTNVETGRSRILGTYTAQDSGEVVVTIRSDPTDDAIRVGGAANIQVSPSTRTLIAGNETITVTIDAGTTDVNEWTVDLIAQKDGQNTTLSSATVTESMQRDFDVNLTEYAEGQLYVDVSWSGDGSLSGRSVTNYGISPNYDSDNSLLGVLSLLPTMIPDDNLDVFRTFVWIIGTILLTVGFATTSRASTETVALVGVGLIGAGSIINWVHYTLMFAVVVTFAALAALRRRI